MSTGNLDTSERVHDFRWIAVLKYRKGARSVQQRIFFTRNLARN